MVNSFRKIFTIVIMLLAIFLVSPASAQTFVAEVDGKTYVLSTTSTSYQAEPELLQSQPWWNNPALAEAIVAQMQYELGDLFGGDQTENIPSALLAYGLNSERVSIVFWDDSVVNCPDYCPSVDDTYVYVIGTVTNPIPANSTWSLLLMSMLLGWVGWRRFSKPV